MFGKINLDGVVYDKIGNIKVNNREYVFTINSAELSFLEASNIDGEVKYTKPNKDMTLEGNAGTSLTRLNERILMFHIAAGLKEDIKSAKIRNQQLLRDSLELKETVLNEDVELKKLIKGNVNGLSEEKFASDAKNLTSYFDTKLKAKEMKDDFDIVDGGEDRTFINAGMYEQIKKQEALEKEVAPEVQTVMTETTSIVEPIVENSTVNPAVETPVVEENKEIISPFPVSDKELTPLVDNMLQRKEELTDAQVTHLEDLQQKEIAKEVIKEEQLEKGKQLVLTKPDKKAAYVDTVILCLVTQLGIFALLIFVLLLIK